ncbi:hypothetical protein L1887_14488 [Cichorium endivia]|nr:hypothetical protein L1887_14488 [Cichorium endivia]
MASEATQLSLDNEKSPERSRTPPSDLTIANSSDSGSSVEPSDRRWSHPGCSIEPSDRRLHLRINSPHQRRSRVYQNQ